MSFFGKRFFNDSIKFLLTPDNPSTIPKQKLKSPSIPSVNYGWTWPCGSEEEDCTILLISHLEIGQDTTFEHIWIPFTQRYFVPSLV